MKSNNSGRSEELKNNYQIFREYAYRTKQKLVDLEQHYVVPWELIEDDTKRRTFRH
jgi:hypothetical protein